MENCGLIFTLGIMKRLRNLFWKTLLEKHKLNIRTSHNRVSKSQMCQKIDEKLALRKNDIFDFLTELESEGLMFRKKSEGEYDDTNTVYLPSFWYVFGK